MSCLKSACLKRISLEFKSIYFNDEVFGKKEPIFFISILFGIVHGFGFGNFFNQISLFKKHFCFFLQDEKFITVGPWLMKLYTTPPSILTLVTWVPQNRQGKLHPSLRGCSAPPPFKWESSVLGAEFP